MRVVYGLRACAKGLSSPVVPAPIFRPKNQKLPAVGSQRRRPSGVCLLGGIFRLFFEIFKLGLKQMSYRDRISKYYNAKIKLNFLVDLFSQLP